MFEEAPAVLVFVFLYPGHLLKLLSMHTSWVAGLQLQNIYEWHILSTVSNLLSYHTDITNGILKYRHGSYFIYFFSLRFRDL